ncbi:Aminopeptidase 2 [Eufriesea mexicana]|uniref:Aminopeptidase 2 n=1 Tax=Eufriesea mexicana TaxID=516756 RepID=A0A310SFV3_9HYME|nr:Aminopeptidase 2 [Eufriesea mexicana]
MMAYVIEIMIAYFANKYTVTGDLDRKVQAALNTLRTKTPEVEASYNGHPKARHPSELTNLSPRGALANESCTSYWFTHDMTQSREVLAMMDTHTTTFGRKRACTVSPCGAFLLVATFFISVVTIGLLVYHLSPCHEGKPPKPCNDLSNTEFEGRGTSGTDTFGKKKLDVRLPRSVIPDSYDLWLIPFIQVGNFTFNGEVKILVNVTEDTKNVTLHAMDMDIDESFTNIKEYNGVQTEKVVKIVDQKNDTERQFYVIRTSDTLKKGKQYVVHLKFVGHLNDYLQGFYRSSYTVGNQTR